MGVEKAKAVVKYAYGLYVNSSKHNPKILQIGLGNTRLNHG